MRQTNTTITGQIPKNSVFGSARKASLLAVLLLGMISGAFAQSHDSENDTLIALNRNAFNLTLLQNTQSQFSFEITNNTGDSIKPFFIELFATGFDFSQDCIINQSINNIHLETNIEKLWGPQFISLGVGDLPVSGKFATTLGTVTNSTGALMKVRLFGTINNKNVVWVGFLKK
jgi:hypothetical protein